MQAHGGPKGYLLPMQVPAAHPPGPVGEVPPHVVVAGGIRQPALASEIKVPIERRTNSIPTAIKTLPMKLELFMISLLHRPTNLHHDRDARRPNDNTELANSARNGHNDARTHIPVIKVLD